LGEIQIKISKQSGCETTLCSQSSLEYLSLSDNVVTSTNLTEPQMKPFRKQPCKYEHE